MNSRDWWRPLSAALVAGAIAVPVAAQQEGPARPEEGAPSTCDVGDTCPERDDLDDIVGDPNASLGPQGLAPDESARGPSFDLPVGFGYTASPQLGGFSQGSLADLGLYGPFGGQDFDLGGLIQLGKADAPQVPAGVLRTTSGPERPGGTSAAKLDVGKAGVRADFGLGPHRAILFGSILWADGAEERFTVAPGTVEAAGFAFGRQFDGSTGFILGDFAGLDGSIRTDLGGFSFGAGIAISLGGESAGPLVALSPFVRFDRREFTFASEVAVSTDIPGFTPLIRQERHQKASDDHYVVGGRLEAVLPIWGETLIGHLSASAALDYMRSSLDSIERNLCDVCSGLQADFTIEVHDSAARLGVRGGLEAALEILLAQNAALVVGGTLEVEPVRGVINPVTGDDVLGTRNTRLGEVEDDLSLLWTVGLSVGF